MSAPHPRTDPQFVDRVLTDLLTHPREWRALGRLHVSAELPSYERSWVVRDAVDTGRKLGLVIEGDGRRGYRFLRFERPGWTRLPGPRSWPPADAQVLRLQRR
jgi:hypothetical protein